MSLLLPFCISGRVCCTTSDPFSIQPLNIFNSLPYIVHRFDVLKQNSTVIHGFHFREGFKNKIFDLHLFYWWFAYSVFLQALWKNLRSFSSDQCESTNSGDSKTQQPWNCTKLTNCAILFFAKNPVNFSIQQHSLIGSVLMYIKLKRIANDLELDKGRTNSLIDAVNFDKFRKKI